jgi:hypothetical protein
VAHRYPLVLAILIYLTLDLSMPGMPGAFVFECENSAEGTQVRARSGAETGALPALIRDPAPVPVPLHLEGDERPAAHVSAPQRSRHLGRWQAQARCEYPRSSEDPH